MQNMHETINIKLADMGGCLINKVTGKKLVQTCYYRSPEILLGIPYNNTSDIWALGCTIYEMLTGEILFDADDFEGNQRRHHFYLIAQKLGLPTLEFLEKSHQKDIFFTTDMKRIKGYNIDTLSCNNDICEKLSPYVPEDQRLLFFDFIGKIFTYEPRPSADELLEHDIFRENR